MMESVKQVQHTATSILPAAWPTNDIAQALPFIGRSTFPEGAVARISKPMQSAMTSGKARAKGWRLAFERRNSPFIEPLMGWTGSDDVMSQVELNFPTLESAICYADRQGLTYVVDA